MTIFKKRSKPQTHIVKHKERPLSPLAASVAGGASANRNWGVRRDEFRTFDSPPGRF